MQTHIYFVRHAHSMYTPDELGRPLSDRGFVDATAVTELLKDEQIDLVISSPYKRAIQTVEGVATYIDREIQLVDDFRERTLSDTPIDNFPSAITKVWSDYDFAWDGGESNDVAQKRGVAATLRVVEDNVGKHVVIGTHGNIMVLIMNYFDGTYDFEFWKKLDMPDIYKLSFSGNKLERVQRLCIA